MVMENGPGAVALGATDRAAAVAAVKALLRVETAAEDALVATLAEAALGLAEQFTGQVTLVRAMQAVLPTAGAWQRLPATPVRAIGAVSGAAEDGEAVPLEVGSYAVDIDAAGGGWVRVPHAGHALVRVAFTAGLAEDWAGLPMPIRQGVAMLAAHLFGARDGSGPPPAAVTALWRPFRAVRLANKVRR